MSACKYDPKITPQNDIVKKIAYYEQKASNNAMLRQIVPSTDEIYQ